LDGTQDHPLLQVIHRRASAEDFDPGRPLSENQVRMLVRDATRAPSAFNIQHWRFVAVRRPEDKERLKAAAYGQGHVATAGVTFIILGDTRAVERLPEIMETAVQRGAIAEGKAVAWIRMAQTIYADDALARDEAIRSASLAAMTMMLAAEARGLAACALTGFDPDRVKREFGIADPLVPVMLLAVGYPAAMATVPMTRLGVDDVLEFDRWRDPERQDE
jgi:nitroreductase